MYVLIVPYDICCGVAQASSVYVIHFCFDTSQKQDRSEFQGPQLRAYECLGQKEPHENPTVNRVPCTVYRAVRLRDGEYLGTANNVESHPRKFKVAVNNYLRRS